MDRERRIELAWVAGSITAAGTIAVFAEPFPPLARYVESEAWTRGVEFVLLIMVLWMLMSAVGLIRANIGVGIDGLTVERLSGATKASRKALEGVQQELGQLQEGTDRLTEELDAVTSKSLADHDKRIGALEDTVRTLSPPDDPSLPEEDPGV